MLSRFAKSTLPFAKYPIKHPTMYRSISNNLTMQTAKYNFSTIQQQINSILSNKSTSFKQKSKPKINKSLKQNTINFIISNTVKLLMEHKCTEEQFKAQLQIIKDIFVTDKWKQQLLQDQQIKAQRVQIYFLLTFQMKRLALEYYHIDGCAAVWRLTRELLNQVPGLQQQFQKTTKAIFQPNHSPSIPQIQILSTNIDILSQPLPILLSKLSPHLNKLSQVSLLIFITTVMVSNPILSLPNDFLNILLPILSLSSPKFNNQHRYTYLSFLYHLKITNSFYSIFQPLSFKASMFDNLTTAKQVQNMAKMLALEGWLSKRGANQIIVDMTMLTSIENFQEHLMNRYNGLSLMDVMKVYNILSKQFAINGGVFREFINKDSRIFLQDLDHVKEFLKQVEKTLRPVLIHSPKDRIKNSVFSSSFVGFVSGIAGQMVKLQPSSALQFLELFEVLNMLKFRQIQEAITNQMSKLSEQLKQNTDIIMKLTKIIALKFVRFEQETVIELANKSYENLMQNKYKNIEKKSYWQFVLNTCKIIKNEDQNSQQKIKHLFETLCMPYIRSHQQSMQNQYLIKSNSVEQEYILRIAGLIRFEHFEINKDKYNKIVSFINNYFLSSAKSVLKYGVFQVLNFLNNFQNGQIRIEIFGYLYSNISSFIRFSSNNKVFYLQRGRNKELEAEYIKVVKNAILKWKQVKNSKNKDTFNMIKLLASIFWFKLSPADKITLLAFIGTPTLLGPVKKRLSDDFSFSQADLGDVDITTLMPFKNLNSSLKSFIQKNSSEQVLNFSHIEQYEQTIQNTNLTEETLMVPPSTQTKAQMIYTCLKIISKIKKQYCFSIPAVLNRQKKIQQDLESNNSELNIQKQKRKLRKSLFTQIDFNEEKSFIRENNLINLKQLNEFHLDNVVFKGHHQVVEGWNSFDDISSLIPLTDYTTYGSADDNPYEKILKIFCGDPDMIKFITYNQPQSSRISQATSMFSITNASKGSLCELMLSNEASQNIIVLSSKPQTYKIHMIWAYLISLKGHLVIQIEESTTREEFQELLETIWKKQLKKRNQKDLETKLNFFQSQIDGDQVLGENNRAL